LDFETHYSQTYSLSKLTTEEYIRDPRFEVIGVSVQVNDDPPEWCSGGKSTIAAFLAKYDWDNCVAVAHNAMFDMAILSWRFGIKPKRIADTLSMARALHGSEVGGSLKVLAEHYGLGAKGDEVIHALGKRRVDFSPDELARYGDYCCNDTALTYKLFQRMCKGFPVNELRLIDLTIRMFTEPTLLVDSSLLTAHLRDVRDKKADLLNKALFDKDRLMSNDKLAELLREMGVEPPMKVSPRTGKDAFAFSKTDEEFKALLEHENPLVQAVVAARLGVKSTLEETRTERFLQITERGTLPVQLRYYAAHTGRWGGDGKLNLQNLPRGGALKKSILAPEGHVIVDSDSSQIECVVADTRVLTRDRGYIKITDITTRDLLWDGIEWVRHAGVVFKGYREVIEYGGITGTPDHVVYTTSGRLPLHEARTQNAELLVGEHGGEAIRVMDRTPSGDTHNRSPTRVGSLRPVHARKTGSGARPARGEVYAVPGACRRESNICGAPPRCREGATAAVLSYSGEHQSYKYEPCVRRVSAGGHPEQVLFVRRVCRPHMGAVPTRKLRGVGTGPYRQHGALRAGQFARGYPGAERPEPGPKYYGGIRRRAHERAAVSPRRGAEMPPNHGVTVAPQRAHGGGNLVPVYDIINCGPRSRFTANGVIISNCRVLAWLAGQDDLVAAFDAGEDVYKIMASAIYGKDPDDVDKDERFVGKTTILGCGYGMGHKRFKLQLKTFGVDMPEEECARIISVYRETYPDIPRLWKEADKALRAIAQDRLTGLGLDGVLQVEGDAGIRLPNGLYLRYPGLRWEEGEKDGFVYDFKRGRAIFAKGVWGGALVENVCQALARIVIGEQMLLVAKKYKPVITVHDAIGVLAPAEEEEQALAYVEQCMRTRPAWAPTLPLNCEAGSGASYGDC
jgi:DNA polymerase I-like protein with 3'-5' exonuclease and polymerase domains